MKVLSLFDGISCARVALERAGIPVELYSAFEIDKYAIAISQKNYPDILQYGSVVGADFSKTEVEYDLLIGGSPCQDLSIAKKDRKGLDGDRSSLFWEYVRILKEVKPKYFILENVASMPKEAKQIITETLGVEPIMIDAALLSAQRRKRLWWVGKLVDGKYETVPVTQPEDRGILLKDILEDGVSEDKSFCIDANYYKGGNEKQHFTKGRRTQVFPNDSVYQYRRTYWRETKGGKVPTLTANMGTGGNNVPYVALTERRTEEAKKLRREYMQEHGKDFSPRRAKELVARTDGKANTITTGMTKESLITIPNGIRKLTVIECEKLQGLEPGYTEGVSNTQRYKALGNAFHVDVVAHILSFIK